MDRIISCLLLGFLLIAPAGAVRAADDPRMVEHGLGDPKAPVRMDEYYSLDCPHCAAFVTETLPDLKSEYIDKGKVYLVLHDFPLHEIALRATMLARCAAPDRFFAMVDTLFRVQRGWILQTMGASIDALKQQAKFAGMSDDVINSCLADHMLEEEILKSRLDAERDAKINATPTFIFNKNVDDSIVSAGPYPDFKKKIDLLLNK